MPLRRVGLLSLHSSPLASLGGPEAGGMNLYVLRLAEMLAETGIEVDIFTRADGPGLPEVVPIAVGARLLHLKAGPQRRVPKSALPLYLDTMFDSLDDFRRQNGCEYDLLHSHYWLSGVVALRFRRRLGLPVIHMFHTLSRVKELFHGQPDLNDTSLRYSGERDLIDGADAVVGATGEEKVLIERLYRQSPRLFSVIPPGVDTSVFRRLDTGDARRTLGLGADRVVLFAGRPDPVKGFDMLVAALGAAASDYAGSVELVVVGESDTGAPQAAKRWGELAAFLPGNVRIVYRGPVPQEHLPRYYSAADICAVPSSYESFGMVAIESMACQTPVVAFDVGGLSTTICQGTTGFLAAPGDRVDYTRRLRQALTAENLDVMGRRGRMSVQRYSWPDTGRRTLELYERVVEESSCSCGQARG